MDATIDSLNIEIESSVSKSTKEIDKLITKLEQLEKKIDDVVNKSSNLSKLKVNVGNINIKDKLEKPSTPTASTTSKQTSTSTATSKANMPKSFTSLDSVIDDVKGIEGVNNEFKQFTDTIGKNGDTITKFKNKSGDLLTVYKKLTNEGERFQYSLKRTTPQVSKFHDAINKLSSGMGTIKAKTVAIIGAIGGVLNKLGEAVNESSKYNESLNLFMVTMGDYAEKGLEWVDKFSNALYLDPANVMQYMGSFNSLVKGLGVGADNSYKMSKNLTQLTFDLASFKNISIESAYEKLMSGISGELEPLRNVGVAMSQNTLQALAYSLGIRQNISDMNEAQKAQLRYIQIMKSSSEWQTDMARTLNQPANALRVLKQQFTLLAREIGNLFIPILMKVVPYVIAFVNVLKSLVKAIANLFGVKLNFGIDYSSYSNTMDGIGNVESGVTDIGDSADKTKQKLNTMLASFDDLNVVQNKNDTSSSSTGGLGTGGDLGVPLGDYNALAGLSDDFQENIKNAEANLKKMLPVVLAIGAGLLAWKIAKGVLNFFNLFNGASSVVSNLSTTGGLLGTIGKGFAVVGGSLLAIGGGIGYVKSLKNYLKDDTDNALDLAGAFGSLAAMVTGVFVVGLAVANPPLALLAAGLTGAAGLLGILGAELSKAFAPARTRQVDILNIGLDKLSKQKLTPLTEQVQDLQHSLDKTFLKNDIITDEQVSEIAGKATEIKDTLYNLLDSEQNEDLKNMSPLKNYMNEEDYNQILGNINNFYENQKNTVSEGEQKIKEITDRASAEHRELTKTERDEIAAINKEFYSQGVSSVTGYTDDYYKIMARLDNNVKAISEETAVEIVTEADKTRDKAVKAAEEQYTNIKAQAMKMKDAGVINDEQYNQIIDSAEKSKKETVKKANEQYTSIYNEVSGKFPKITSIIDKETGKQKNSFNDWGSKIGKAFEGVIGWITKFTGFDKFFNSFISNSSKSKKISLPLDATLTPSTSIQKQLGNIKGFASGGYPNKSDLFFANENGVPEMVGRIGNQTAVANKDQIATTLTNALITALDQYDFGGNNNSPTTIYIGNKKVYEGYGDYAQQENDRYGTNVIRI